MSLRLFPLALCALTLACEAAPVDSPAAVSELPAGLACDEPYPGGQHLEINIVDARPGYDEELAALDLDALAPTIDLSEITALRRAVLLYALDLPPDTQTLDVAVARARGPLGDAMVAGFAVLDPAGQGGLDYSFLRRGLARYYGCDRRLPKSLDDLRLRSGDWREVPPFVLEQSHPKRERRHIYELDGYSIAETIHDGEVRETEVLLPSDRADGSLDFAAFDEFGLLMDRSTFAADTGDQVVTSSPYTCLSCHRDQETQRFDVRIPVMHDGT
ncbi:MAG: hypothetical protein ACO3JL_01240 [Myxococcota bacterium]